MEEEASEVTEHDALVMLAMTEMLGPVSVIETLTVLGMHEIIAEAKELAAIEREEDGVGGDSEEGFGDPLEDPEADEIADAEGDDE